MFVLYGMHPHLLEGIDNPDSVFPHFIATQLPVGLAGLVVAGIFAASMDSNLNSMATLTLCDLYKRYYHPEASDREATRVLRAATLFWGILGTGMGLWMIHLGMALDALWRLGGLFSGGVLGLFLLGLVSRKADNVAVVIATLVGLLVIIWMFLPSVIEIPEVIRTPWHSTMTVVVGTLTIFWLGLAITAVRSRLW